MASPRTGKNSTQHHICAHIPKVVAQHALFVAAKDAPIITAKPGQVSISSYHPVVRVYNPSLLSCL